MFGARAELLLLHKRVLLLSESEFAFHSDCLPYFGTGLNKSHVKIGQNFHSKHLCKNQNVVIIY